MIALESKLEKLKAKMIKRNKGKGHLKDGNQGPPKNKKKFIPNKRNPIWMTPIPPYDKIRRQSRDWNRR